MPPHDDATAPVSLILAGLVFCSAVFLGYRQYREARHRPPALLPRDEKYFALQDLRRAIGTIVLLILSLALAVGGQMPTRINGKANLKFIQIWSGVAFLLVALLGLAALDMLATRIYARRQRQQIVDEGLAIIESELRSNVEARRRAALHQQNGHASPPSSPSSDGQS